MESFVHQTDLGLSDGLVKSLALNYRNKRKRKNFKEQNLNAPASELKPVGVFPMRALKIQTVLEHKNNITDFLEEKQEIKEDSKRGRGLF